MGIAGFKTLLLFVRQRYPMAFPAIRVTLVFAASFCIVWGIAFAHSALTEHPFSFEEARSLSSGAASLIAWAHLGFRTLNYPEKDNPLLDPTGIWRNGYDLGSIFAFFYLFALSRTLADPGIL